MRWLRWAGIALFLGVIVSPFLHFTGHAGASKRMQLANVERRPIRSSIIASGTYLYENQVQLSPEVLGRVVEILVREGDHVNRGDLLLRIQDATYASEVAQRRASVASQGAALRQTLAALSNERRKLQRLSQLQERGFAARSVVDDARDSLTEAESRTAAARADVAQSEALLRQAEETLRKTSIRAPTSGVVVQLTTRVGETVVPSSVNLAGSSLLTIAETSALMADVNVDEADVGNVRADQEVALTAAAFPDKPILGTVASIALSPGRNDTRALGLASPQSSQARSYSVRVRLGAARLDLRSGMTCRAEIYTSTADRMVAVPVEAVITDGAGTSARDAQSVFIVRDGRARRQIVKLGPSDDRFQAILAGVKPGDTVVTGPADILHGLSDGDAVTAG